MGELRSRSVCTLSYSLCQGCLSGMPNVDLYHHVKSPAVLLVLKMLCSVSMFTPQIMSKCSILIRHSHLRGCFCLVKNTNLPVRTRGHMQPSCFVLLSVADGSITLAISWCLMFTVRNVIFDFVLGLGSLELPNKPKMQMWLTVN